MIRTKDLLDLLLHRQSASAKRLLAPGPNDAELHMIVAAALTAPDHGDLKPWRFLIIPDTSRDALADLFAAAAERDTPGSGDKAREKSRNAPCLVAIIARITPDHKIPVAEQYASVGAAMAHMLLAANALGYGAVVLSGARTRDPDFKAGLGLDAAEDLVGFVNIGTLGEAGKPKTRPSLDDHLRVWTPE